MNRSKSDIYFVMSLLALSISLNVWLGIERRSSLMLTTAADVGRGFLKGDSLETVEVHSLAGGAEVLQLKGRDRPTILYIISPTCHWCARNTNNARALFLGTRHAYDFFVIATRPEGLDDFLRTHDLGSATFLSSTTPSYGTDLSRVATPMTLVVAPTGIIEKAWIGAYAADHKQEIERHFNLLLPGLSDTTSVDVLDNTTPPS